MTTPLVGITTDLEPADGRPKAALRTAYARAVAAAGATPILLPPIPKAAGAHAALCNAFILSGGDDPRTEPFGRPTHPAATPVHEDRQNYETRLLRTLEQHHPDKPVLGVCLGMQMMALVAGGELDQHLPDTMTDAARHWDAEHPVAPCSGLLSAGLVFSRHRQAVTDPGALRVQARADDGLIEAVSDPRRRFYLGVQWHPERTRFPGLGENLFAMLASAAHG
jgi:putative glutamine amidotransferase